MLFARIIAKGRLIDCGLVSNPGLLAYHISNSGNALFHSFCSITVLIAYQILRGTLFKNITNAYTWNYYESSSEYFTVRVTIYSYMVYICIYSMYPWCIAMYSYTPCVQLYGVQLYSICIRVRVFLYENISICISVLYTYICIGIQYILYINCNFNYYLIITNLIIFFSIVR